MVEKRLINEQFQGKVVVIRLPLREKLAFLNVLRPNSSSPQVTSSRHDFDSFMVAVIFRFGSDDFKRRIMWEE